MCATCGCSEGAQPTVSDPATGRLHRIGAHEHDARKHHDHEHDHTHHHDPHHEHDAAHDHDHGHEHVHDEGGGHAHMHGRAQGTIVTLLEEVLTKNNRLAERNRGWLQGRSILALNLVSSPGAGKTTLLERTIRDLKRAISISVVEGDQETLLDAERIRATGCKSVQVNTGTGCHLEAQMLASAL